MTPLSQALLLATLAGLTIPVGAFAAMNTNIRPQWLNREFRHTVIAFGGGILLAAIALVLVPEGRKHLESGWVIFSFAAGGLAFFFLDRAIERRGGSVSQLLAMLLDFIPEAMALGAMMALQNKAGLLLALMIALQNLPEGFNAFREIMQTGKFTARKVLSLFTALVLLGPVAAYTGHTYLASHESLLGALMLFAAGGILYLTFQDIAPQARLKKHWAPSLGAVAGFLMGLTGSLILG